MKKKNPKFFISCGEFSGETHAAKLLLELYKLDPSTRVRGFGSSLLKELGVNLVEDYREFSFSGITEVITNFPRIFTLRKRLLEAILKFKPDAVILVDYGGLNLSLAAAIKKQSKIPVYYYIAPQIWASRPWRIQKMKNIIDYVFCTLPFEVEIYNQAGIRNQYIGSPVLASITSPMNKEEFYKSLALAKFRRGQRQSPSLIQNAKEEILIGLFPGSRKAEIHYMLPMMIQAARDLQEQVPNQKFRFVLAKAPTISYSLLEKYGIIDPLTAIKEETRKDNLVIEVLEPNDMLAANHKLLSAADFLWLCSGTVTLEASLYATPYLLSYKSTILNYWVYLLLRTVKKAGLANIISGQDLATEFLQGKANSFNIVSETLLFINDPKHYETKKQSLIDFRKSLSELNAPSLAAEIIFQEVF